MRIELATKNFKEDDNLKKLIDKKLSRFDKYFQDSAKAKVKLYTITDNIFAMEVTILYNKKLIRASSNSSDMKDNIDIIIPKLEKQLNKYRTRQIDLGRKPIISEEIPSIIEEKSKLGKIVKIKNFDISIITVEDAIAELELLDHNFYVFVNAETNKVSVLYKRNDGDYGLITPEY